MPFIPIVVEQKFCHCGAMKTNPPKNCCSPAYQCWKVDDNLGAFQQYKCVKFGDPDPIYVPITKPRRKSWLPSVYNEWIDFPETSSLEEIWDWGIGGSLQNPVPFPVGTATPEAILSRGDIQSFVPPRCLRAKWSCFDLGTLETEIGMEIQMMQGPPVPPLGCVCDEMGPPAPTLCERKPKECALCKLLKLPNCPQDLFDILGCNDIKDCWTKLLRNEAILLGYGKLIVIGYDWIDNSYAKIFLKSLLAECIIYDDLTGMLPVGVDPWKFKQGFMPMLWGMGDNQTGPCPPNRLDTQRIFEEILRAMDNQETAKPFVELLRGYLEGLSEQERIAFELWLIHELLWNPPKF